VLVIFSLIKVFWSSFIDSILNRLINGLYCLPCFALLVMFGAATKIHFEEQAQVGGTTQSSQPNKTGRLTRHSGLPIEIGLEHAHFVVLVDFFLIWTCKESVDYGPQQH
jgi:hypothetical protein